MSPSYDYSSSDDEWDLEQEEDIAMLLAFHTNKRTKHGGSVFGRQKLRRERIKRHNKLKRIYVVDDPIDEGMTHRVLIFGLYGFKPRSKPI
jgi:hypothetical protein